MRFAQWHGKTFIGSEDNVLMPTGGTGFNEVSSLGKPVLFFSGQPAVVLNLLCIIDVYIISSSIVYRFENAKGTR
jgi:hypothetical protein